MQLCRNLLVASRIVLAVCAVHASPRAAFSIPQRNPNEPSTNSLDEPSPSGSINYVIAPQSPPPTIEVARELGCKLGNKTFPIGLKWHPHLPEFGTQFCVVCHCTIKFEPAGKCYRPAVVHEKLDERSATTACPKAPVECLDGSPPKPSREHPCCRACEGDPPQVAHRPANHTSGWTQRSLGETGRPPRLHADSHRPQATVGHTSGVKTHRVEPDDLGYELANTVQGFWLFKIIAKGAKSELISAVKSVPFCPDGAH